MIIRHFLYNAFLIEEGEIKIAIDPGLNLWMLNLRSLLPKPEWGSITHVLVTHGDPDHYWFADKVAKAAQAPLIMNRTMIRAMGTETHILAPRRRGLTYVPFAGDVVPMEAGESRQFDGVRIEGIKTVHGPIEFEMFGRKQRDTPGPEERVGFGSLGFRIQVGDRVCVNLGDSLLREEWAELKPDVLMLPIGGLGNNTWTMNLDEALEAVRIIAPKLVIPCHYSVPFFWKRKMAPADDQAFQCGVEKQGIKCRIMRSGETIEIEGDS
jgi:L-ascorbate metabolism protein UlaG (beta-lactamase superfamily)